MDHHDSERIMRRLSRIGSRISLRDAEDRISADQRKRFSGVNFMTPNIWGYRLVNGGSIIAEVSYGRGMAQDHLFGVTVYCIGDLADKASVLDHALSAACYEEEALIERVTWLNVYSLPLGDMLPLSNRRRAQQAIAARRRT